MKKMYNKQLVLFGYSIDNYRSSMSNKNISISRLKKLNKVTEKELENIKECINNFKVAGYQEKLVDNILSFVNDLNKDI